ncbi:tryptophan-rich sensory protein [Roseivirga sp. E12]|uniref:tryptophan-rich sensory protein n=1 Tax=Roseivirga sp. E12 TaxID=2819237 RepID=UPI001ABC225D|nr:tryptophan-rich sensory protein [Roseivirga sp. E12]MBO3700750.1 tryptophan-rich sensory protein [Roseivirga sp. E12]
MTKSTHRLWAVTNAIVLALVVYWNYHANAQGINENSVGSLSAAYDNLFTPSSYAFSIWALIYIALFSNAIFQVRAAFKDINTSFFKPLGPFLMIANLGNALWIWAWLTERTGLSVIIMVVILFSLMTAVVKLGIRSGDRSPGAIKRWVWWPVSLYFGWITVATVANISAYLAKIEWSFLMSEINWASAMIIIAAIIYLIVLAKRGMITFALVGVWAFTAIAHKQWGVTTQVAGVALGASISILIFSIMQKTKDMKLKSS